MHTFGAALLFSIPALAIYAIARWAGAPRAPQSPIEPSPRVTALDNAFERFERPPIKRTADGKFAKRKAT